MNSWRRAPHAHGRIMMYHEQRAAAQRIRTTNIVRPFVDDDQRLMAPRKLARDWGFKVYPNLALMVLLGRRLNREFVWKVHASSPYGKRWLRRYENLIRRAAGMFLRTVEIAAQLDDDWFAQGNQAIFYYEFIPDPLTEGFAEVASGKTNYALAAGPDEVEFRELLTNS